MHPHWTECDITYLKSSYGSGFESSIVGEWHDFIDRTQRSHGGARCDSGGFLAFCINHMTADEREQAQRIAGRVALSLNGVPRLALAQHRLDDLDDCKAVAYRRFRRINPQYAGVSIATAIERGILDLLQTRPTHLNCLHECFPFFGSVLVSSVVARMEKAGSIRRDTDGRLSLVEEVRS